MQVNVTRYEETGYVFDFGTQNAVIIVFVSLCLVGLIAAFILYATAPHRSDTTRIGHRRLLLTPVLIVGAVVAISATFFATNFYRSPVFPDPKPTTRLILAQSARTAVLNQLRATYPGPSSFDSSSDMASDAAQLRSASPRTHRVRFSVTINGITRRCVGTVRIAPAVPSTQAAPGSRDQLNPDTGKPADTYAPVITTAQCT